MTKQQLREFLEQINFTTDFRRNTLRSALIETIKGDAGFHNANIGQGQSRIDIAIEEGGERTAIKLEMPMKGARPNYMYDFVEDLALLEQRMEAADLSKGFLVVVTKDRLFWEGVDHTGIYKYFRTPTDILHGRIYKHVGQGAGIDFHEPAGRYRVQWKTLNNGFRYFIIEINNGKSPSSALISKQIKLAWLSKTRQAVYNRLQDPNDRMHSWEHCYRFFQGLGDHPEKQQIDTAALHLACYLASYGMFRGSTVLLQKNYKFLVPVIKRLKTSLYERLRVVGDDVNTVIQVTCEQHAKLAWAACEDLEGFLRNDLKIGQANLGILVTKILLGTWCCTPAFDSEFKKTLVATGFGNNTWSRKNFMRCFTQFRQHGELFQAEVDWFHKNGYQRYPAIRIIDALFWVKGLMTT